MSTSTVHPYVAGYVAAQLLRGVYTSIALIPSSRAGLSGQQALAILEIWNRLYAQHQSELLRFVSDRQSVDTNPDRELRSVLSGLKRHSLPLSVEVCLICRKGEQDNRIDG